MHSAQAACTVEDEGKRADGGVEEQGGLASERAGAIVRPRGRKRVLPPRAHRAAARQTERTIPPTPRGRPAPAARCCRRTAGRRTRWRSTSTAAASPVPTHACTRSAQGTSAARLHEQVRVGKDALRGEAGRQRNAGEIPHLVHALHAAYVVGEYPPARARARPAACVPTDSCTPVQRCACRRRIAHPADSPCGSSVSSTTPCTRACVGAGGCVREWVCGCSPVERTRVHAKWSNECPGQRVPASASGT